MSIKLTPEQQQALDRDQEAPHRIVDPRTDAAYVLVPEGEYEALREILEDEQHERAVHGVALRNASVRLDEVS